MCTLFCYGMNVCKVCVHVCFYELVMQLTAVLVAILSTQKTKGHKGENESLQRTIIMNPAIKTPMRANPQFSSLHYSFADSKTNINISNININSHKTVIPLQK